MQSILLSVLGIYLFIIVGFVAKWSFKEKIDEKTLVLLSVYFLQVFLTFWGLLKRPIDGDLLAAPLYYLLVFVVALALMAPLSRMVFKEQKERSIATIAALIGNTGNLGIPLGIAIFGEVSVPYTTMINLVNVFTVYTFGVFYYSRGSFSVRDSLMNIVKLPILWAAMAAIALNLSGYTMSADVELILQMGAYASMVIQLVIFGIYLYGTQLQQISRRLLGWVTGVKFIILPLITYVVLEWFETPPMVEGLVFMELMMPLAVANVNLASLYDCRPRVVTVLVLVTSVLFLGLLFFGIEIINRGFA